VWWEEKSQAPAAFATEILAATKSPTDALAEAIIQLNNLGKLDPEFAKLFNLTAPDGAIAKAAGSNATEARLAQLEREEQARKEAQETAQLHDRWAAEIESQIQEVVVANGLSFATPQDAAKFRSDLINTAAERGTETIAIAYELMEAARLKAAALEAKKTQKVNSKRAMRVVSKPTDAPSGSSGTKVTDWRSASRIAVDAAL
jgi:hypothetical protein